MHTIRTRLLTGFLLIALLPTIGIGMASSLISYRDGQRQVLERLESVASLRELELENWLADLHNELMFTSNEEYTSERATVVLDLAYEQKHYTFYNEAVRHNLTRTVEQSARFEEILLLDHQGMVALSTNPATEGQIYDYQHYFRAGLRHPTAQLSFRPPHDAMVAIPIAGPDRTTLGVMAGRTQSQTLHAILTTQTGIGKTGKIYLVNSDYQLLDESTLTHNTPVSVYRSHGIERVLEQQTDGGGVYHDHRGTLVVGVYRWLPSLRSGLIIEQDLSEAYQALYTTLTINTGVTLLAILLALGLAFFITRSIATPLAHLAYTTKQIAAGDLQQVAHVERKDEIGVLAQSFNHMTKQLRDLISGLERRVEQRTQALYEANQALQQRALQLETSAQVSQEIISTLDIDQLLTRVVMLIRTSFGYHDVRLYLLDPATQQLILRAYSTPAPLIDDMPDTNDHELYATLSVSLRTGDHIIGHLFIINNTPDPFSDDERLVIQSLGDQIVTAIENARLYERDRQLAVVEERNRLARDLHDSVTQSLYSLGLLAEGWRRQIRTGHGEHTDEYLRRIGEITLQALKEMRLLIHELRPPDLAQQGFLGALRQRLESVESRAGITTQLIVDHLIELPPPVETGLYRIAQEALNNTLKHAQATSVTIHMSYEQDDVLFEICDDGKGFDSDAIEHSGGMGLRNMHERAQQIHAALTIHSQAGAGTRVSVYVPSS
ncbi:MAG: hypothetical protein GFH27_549289n355 [Chloroflexi bacterium AL-W]|nr:hypothetical protein [Chloroflexi bacterium AL-N1]NOK67087.1 hypothetical protein [Chloroflexi bacterium AL-N10]NOK74620.1 hypothetical protein [Chloroflexi bacterium AL-N5]NOK81689.1 hypothetical protein [Chloroflexi bacterium AL-W]NOK89159.1 hypothetical protein [Chloroflexi bacterium AL-N15]